MAKDEYDALVETSYLLSSPKNAQRLISSLKPARNHSSNFSKILAKGSAASWKAQLARQASSPKR